VTVEATPPEGFTSDQPALSASLADSTLQVLQFTLTDVGSTWTQTALTTHIRHRGQQRLHASRSLMVNKRGGKRPKGPTTAGDPSAGTDFVPIAYALFQNAPDPFNPTTTLQFDLPEPAVVTLKVYDVRGAEVAAVLEKRRYPVGRHRVVFDAAQVPAGVYFYRLTAGPFTSTKKMLVIK
jgi:hypothetical protein